MRRPSLITILVFVAGLGIGYFVRGLGAPQHGTRQVDVAAIQKLNQQNIDVTLARDLRGLADLWAEDAVRPRATPGSPPAVGKQAIAADNENFYSRYPGLKVLAYKAQYKDLQIEDDLACEWSEQEGNVKLSPESAPVSWHAKGFMVLKRQNDGAWKAEYAYMK